MSINLGVIGTGRIASRFAEECKFVPGITVNCVYNTNTESAERFAKAFLIESFESDLEAFFSKVDCVYIATPHEFHGEYIRKALIAKKHVLCEKPMTFSKNEAEELFGIAEEKNSVLMEALKTLYCPGFIGLMDLIKEGSIGKIYDVEATFTKLIAHDDRPFFGKYSGAFYELGSYPLLAILSILGNAYENIDFISFYNDNNVDIYTKAIFKYPDAIATAKTGIGVKSEGELIISGQNGYIYVPAPWWLTKRVEIRRENPDENKAYEYEFKGGGLRYEINRFLYRIENNVITDESEDITKAISCVMSLKTGNKNEH